MSSEINIDINDIEYLPDGKTHYVFWRGIYIGSIEKEKRTQYTPPELIGKWECGYTSNDYCDTKELAAINSVRKFLKHHPDRIDRPKDDDLQEAEKFKSSIEYFKRIRAGDYGPEYNVLRDDFKKWCIDNNVGDEKFQSKLVNNETRDSHLFIRPPVRLRSGQAKGRWGLGGIGYHGFRPGSSPG